MPNIAVAKHVNFIMQISALPKTTYWMQDIQLPAMNINSTHAEAFPLDIPIAGEKASFDPLTVAFIIDDNWENYEEIFNLMYKSVDPTNEFIRNQNSQIQFDVKLIILNSNKRPIMHIDFIDAIPTTLDGVSFDSATDRPQSLLSAITFEYSYMNITRIN